MSGRTCTRSGRIIPAYAGSTSSNTALCHRARDHPRIRGEHPLEKMRFRFRSGSSPHTRGAPRVEPRRGILRWIIPAYAGSTGSVIWTVSSTGDHPRIRGEHEFDQRVRVVEAGSSPHTRGARPGLRCSSRRARIIPAYAGSTTLSCARRSGIRDHPRIRGEHLAATSFNSAMEGSSPHTRGARLGLSPGGLGARIIPAYAGSTTHLARKCPSWTDHPRIRGEHPVDLFVAEGGGGSSPHTRGARRAA